MAATKWEYSHGRITSEALVSSHATSKSADGWELISVVLDPQPGLGSWVMFFKRLKKVVAKPTFGTSTPRSVDTP